MNFESIALPQQRAYADRLAACPQKTSDYSFINLWGWAQEYGLLWAWTDSLVWIKQTRPETVCWAPIGPWEKIDWMTETKTPFFKNRPFIRVPEKLVEIWKASFNDRIRVQESRGQWDYIYDATELIALRGNRFHKKKNLLNQFTKKYDFDYRPFESDVITHALDLQTDWCTWRDCESSDILAAENRVIQRILSNWNKINGIIGGGLLVGETMVAYTVAERLMDSVLLIHFEKANQAYKGAYQTINQVFLSHCDNTIKTVNREQDLDDDGLRKAKLSYHPIDYLRKYRITFQ